MSFNDKLAAASAACSGSRHGGSRQGAARHQFRQDNDGHVLSHDTCGDPAPDLESFEIDGETVTAIGDDSWSLVGNEYPVLNILWQDNTIGRTTCLMAVYIRPHNILTSIY